MSTGPADPHPLAHLRCPRCSAPVGPEQDWCLECGAPARTALAATPNWRLPTVAIGAIVAVAGALLAFAFVNLTGDDEATPVSTAPTAAAPTTPAPTPAVPPVAAPGTTTAPATPPTAPAPAPAAPPVTTAPPATGAAPAPAPPRRARTTATPTVTVPPSAAPRTITVPPAP